MKIPKAIKIGGHLAKVSAIKTKGHWKGFGSYDPKTNDIVILQEHDDVKIAPSLQRTTMLHEVLHAVFDISGLANKYNVIAEEEFIRTLEPILFQVMRDNPKLVQFIMAK